MTDAFLPPEVFIPLPHRGNNGQEYRYDVRKGDMIEEGQMIASIGNRVIHSSVPGRVEGVVKLPLADGSRGWCIKITTGGAFKYLGHRTKASGYEGSINSILQKGVLNTFNGICFPAPLAEECAALKVNTVVVCLGDEDPSVKTTSMLSKIKANEVKEGARITANATGAKRIVFVGEEGIRALYESEAAPASQSEEFAASVFRRYPSAFQTDLKKKIKDLPEEGVLFVDANTMLNVREAVVFGTPSITSYVHISGECLKAEGLLKVRVGTPIRFLAEQCGGLVKKCEAIIINGFMVGYSGSLDTPIDKYVKSVVFMPKGVLRSQGESECISCGNCREVCPEHLLPDVLFMKGLESGSSGEVCTGCGLCNSVCPARLPLVQNIFADDRQEAEE